MSSADTYSNSGGGQDAPVVSAAANVALAKLKDLQTFISEQSWTTADSAPQSLMSVIIENEPQQLPFLTVIPAPTQPDPFLRDLNSLRMNCSFVTHPDVPSDFQLKAFLYSATSREIVLEVVLTDDFLSDMGPVLNTITSSSANTKHCPGFDAIEADDVFAKARKADIPNLLIERYDGRILYRSRSCKYVVFNVDVEESSVKKVNFGSGAHCSDCDRLFTEMDMKYNGGKYSSPEEEPAAETMEEEAVAGLETIPEEKEEEREGEGVDEGTEKKSKRRSRGVNKAIFGSDYVDPDAALEVRAGTPKDKSTTKVKVETAPRVEVKSEPKNENDENTPANAPAPKEEEENSLAMTDDPNDQDYLAPRRTSRKRKLTNKLLQDEAGLLPRKRGRPPTLTDPTKCQECGKVFVVLKEYREHIVSCFYFRKEKRSFSGFFRFVSE